MRRRHRIIIVRTRPKEKPMPNSSPLMIILYVIAFLVVLVILFRYVLPIIFGGVILAPFFLALLGG